MSILTYRGQNIEQRQSDGYVNLTQMAKANNAEVKHFNDSEFAQKYMEALQESIGRDSRLIEVKGFGAEKATWGHPLVAIAFGQWISPEFHVWCNVHIKTLMETGSTTIAEQPKLPSRVMALETAKAIAEIQELLTNDNPRLAQFLIDHAISDIMPSQPLLDGERLRGVVEIAVDMGFPVSIKNRSQLGTFVKSRCRELARSEKRLVNGLDREVACYPENNEEVRKAIADFFTK